MRLGQTLLAGALAAATIIGTAVAGSAAASATHEQARAHQSQGYHLHDYPPVRVRIQPSTARPRSTIHLSFRAPFDLQPGDIWTAAFTTCAQITRGRLRHFPRRAQFVNQKV